MNPLIAAAAVQAAPGIMEKSFSIMKLVFLTAVTVGGGYFIYKKIKGNTKETPGNNLSKLQISKTGLSFSDSEYGIMAQSLYLAMDGPGTDEETIFAIIQSMRNRDDLLMLIKAFGIRRYGVVTSLWFGSDLNLVGWFNEELGSKDKIRVREIFNALNVPF
ncbi:hypothetical protein BY457_11113 [Marinilabilia salmonicolor]|jgi:hypothetical protein|uniref:hypothetical protein n=1 Tax=Marinilabilia salmonicolor TaxID=989 RepID=UPI000D04A77B|nr:hypothetical protein [Marinilabilia salmonicolor]PRY97733.1 hypothetical protein BY457_11113 [Marinilabilia salmonicolor]